jgi:hypothetical protein
MEMVDTPLRLTVGEIAFAVAQLYGYDQAVKLVAMQFEVKRLEDALILIQTSGQSLYARELVVSMTPVIQLAPPLLAIGKIFGSSEWMLRCTRAPIGCAMETLLLHFSGTGVLCHEVVSDHVQCVAQLNDSRALLVRLATFFGLPYTESALPRAAITAQIFEQAWTQVDAAKTEAVLRQPGLAGLLRVGLSTDLATAQWKGGISKLHYPRGQTAEVEACLYLASDQRTWMFEPDHHDRVLVAEATQQRLLDIALRIIERVPATERRF